MTSKFIVGVAGADEALHAERPVGQPVRDLERPEPDETAIVIDIVGDVTSTVDQIVRKLEVPAS